MKILLLLTLCCGGCAFEWDAPKVPQRDPLTGQTESKYVYWPARHPMPPIEIPSNLNQH